MRIPAARTPTKPRNPISAAIFQKKIRRARTSYAMYAVCSSIFARSWSSLSLVSSMCGAYHGLGVP
nr:MAG TPA: hypothetical protein [Caudoviricetes sp.]